LRRGARVGLVREAWHCLWDRLPCQTQLHCRIFRQTAVALTKITLGQFSRAFRLRGHDLKVLERSKSTEICAEFVAGFMANIGGYPSLVHPQERERNGVANRQWHDYPPQAWVLISINNTHRGKSRVLPLSFMFDPVILHYSGFRNACITKWCFNVSRVLSGKDESCKKSNDFGYFLNNIGWFLMKGKIIWTQCICDATTAKSMHRYVAAPT
jgi:hypothetical protein